MANVAEPDCEELQEIGRRLCALVDLAAEEPVCAESLRDAVHDPACRENKFLRFALVMCADALEAHELAPELRRLRKAVDAYAAWSDSGAELRAELIEATESAMALTDDEADRRGEALAEALTDEERAEGLVAKLWPSPESLRTFPRAALDLLKREPYVVGWLRKVMHDLSRLNADYRIAEDLAPIKTRLAKTLASGGYSHAQIATVLEPWAKPGRERKRARNAITKRLKSKAEDLLYPTVRVSESNAAEMHAAANFVAGVGANVRVLFGRALKNEQQG